MRPAIKRCIAAITHSFYEEWLSELAAVKKAFEAARLSPPDNLYFPGSVAQVSEILGLRHRLASLLEQHKVSIPQ